MRKVINKAFESKTELLDDMILNFHSKGEVYGQQDRNSLKLFDFNGKKINIKSFKIPNIINKIAYNFFRKSKAQRSYEYANKLIELGIGTPQPMAYYEFRTPLFFKKSFYLSEHLKYELTYRELTTNFDYPDYDNILRAFTRFTYQLHQKGVNFLDHSPGNTLIRKNGTQYNFFLVDLNRMSFETMNFTQRMKNMSKLTIHKSMVETMSDEYAKCSGENYYSVFNSIWTETQDFQYRFHRRRKFKKIFKFWKK